MRARGSNLRQPRCSSSLARCCDLRHRDAGSARSSTTRPLSTKPRHSCARGQAFGPIDAAVIALMPELGNLSPKATAALAGLAPFNTESGRLKSNRSISGGQMARAQCALHGRTRCCPSKTRLAAFYKSLRNAGKAPKLALIALARKLLVILTAVLRDKTAFVPSSKIQLPACAGMTMRQAPRLRQP